MIGAMSEGGELSASPTYAAQALPCLPPARMYSKNAGKNP